MPCCNPLDVVNPTRYYSPGVDRVTLSVPCNKCVGCQLDKQNSWFIRNYLEFCHTKEQGGFTLFPLLTYSNSCIPRFSKISPYKSNVYCFNSRDIKKFLNSLRRWTSRRGIEFSYFIASEYGEKTKRPHYHALIHFRKCHFSPAQVLTELRKLWHWGRISPNKSVEDLLINNYQACEYVSKYVTKDINFYNVPHVKKLMDDNDLKEQCKHCLPNHYQSNNYGASYLDNIMKSADPFAEIEKGIHVLFKNRNYALPQYLLNKLIYDKEPDGRYEDGQIRYKRSLNGFGYFYKCYQFDRVVNKMTVLYNHFFSYPYINSIYTNYSHVRKLFKDKGLNSVDAVYNHIRSLLAFRPVEYFSLYVLGFRNKTYNSLPYDYNDLKDIYLDSFFNKTNISKCIYTKNVASTSFHITLGDTSYNISARHSRVFTPSGISNTTLCNCLSQFKDFDSLLEVCAILKSEHSRSTQSYKIVKDRIIHRLKDFFNPKD